MFRRSRGPLDEIDPAQLPVRWRGPVIEALDHRSNFRTFLDRIDPGPLRARVNEAAAGVDDGVLAVWGHARRGDLASQALSTNDPGLVRDQLKAAQRNLADAESDAERAAIADEVAVLAARHASLQRLWNTVDEIDEQLASAVNRIGAAVAQVMELSVVAATSPGDDGRSRALDDTILELRSLREALDEIEHPPPPRA